MKVVDFRTRQPVEQIPIAIDDGEHHSRLRRVLLNFLIDAESLGIGWSTLRSWLVSALRYVDAKIAQQQPGKRQ